MLIDKNFDLIGKLLIVMLSMLDFCFFYFVVFMCVYSEDGVMGLIVNKFFGFMKLLEILVG